MRTPFRGNIENICVGDDAHIVPRWHKRFMRRFLQISYNFRVGAGIARPTFCENARTKTVVKSATVFVFYTVKKMHPSVGSRRAVTGMGFPILETPDDLRKMHDDFAGSCTRADVGIGPYARISTVRFAGGQCPPLRGGSVFCKCLHAATARRGPTGAYRRADVGIGPYARISTVRFAGGQCPPLRGAPVFLKMPAPTRRSRVFENACTRPRHAVALRVHTRADVGIGPYARYISHKPTGHRPGGTVGDTLTAPVHELNGCGSTSYRISVTV